jgi:hypothetical protein
MHFYPNFNLIFTKKANWGKRKVVFSVFFKIKIYDVAQAVIINRYSEYESRES